MADRFDELLQSMVDMDYEQLLNGAKRSLTDSYKIFADYSDEDHAVVGVVTFLAAAVAVDGTFSANEKRLIKDLFGDVDFMATLRTIGDDDFKAMNSLVDALPPEKKAVLCTFATYVLAVDNHINKDEYRYLIDLLD